MFDTLKLVKRMVPTDSSLELARRVAELTGLPFDRDETDQEARVFQNRIFADVCSLIGRDASNFHFEAGLYLKPRLFAANRSDGKAVIGLDERFDYWLMSLSQLTAIATFETPDAALWQRLLAQADDLMAMFMGSTAFERVRDEMIDHMISHAHLLNLSAALGRAALVFALCHEIAHIEAEHLSLPQDPQQEIEADIAAAKMFVGIVEAGETGKDTYAYVDPKVAAAPLILTEFVRLLEDWLKHKGLTVDQGQSHPDAVDRLAAIDGIIKPMLGEVAVQVLGGYRAGLDDLRAGIAPGVDAR